MNSSASNSESRRVRYLTQAFRMNPVVQAEKIIELRSAYLGLKSLPSARRTGGDEQDLDEQRAWSIGVIERVRQEFWQLHLKTLKGELAGLKLERLPDLQYAASRLSIAAANRDALPPLAEHKGFDATLFTALKTVLVASPRDSGSVKEKFRRRLDDRQKRKQAARMVRLLKRNVPEIYELEQDWLESIARYRPPKANRSASSEGGFGFHISFGGWGWAVWILIILGLRLLRAISST